MNGETGRTMPDGVRVLVGAVAAIALAVPSALAGVGDAVGGKSLPSDLSATEKKLDPRPVVTRMTEAIGEIQNILQQQKPTNDKLVIRCVEDKLTVAQKARAQALAAIPDLKKQPDLTQGGVAAVASASRRSTESGQPPAGDPGLSPEKTVMGAAEKVERQLTAARLCTRIHSGEVVLYDEGTKNVAGDIGDDEIDIPDFADIDPIPVRPPVSLVN